MYRKIKIVIYLIGFAVVAYFYFKDGIIDFTHTPLPAFAISTIILMLAVSWLFFDFIFSNILKLYKTGLKIYLNSIFSSFIICILIIIFSFF